jgi:Zn-dependent M28 family amino/carboxypeptidase
VGDVVGHEEPDEMIYIVAHRDTTYINPGAVDNTVGTVTIMELARQLAKYKVEKTIRFISVDAEEKGLLGATEYVKAHEDEVQEHGIICFNFDMNDVNLERVDTLNIRISNTGYIDELNDIRDMMFDRYPDLDAKYDLNITEGGGGPDAAPFEKRGIDGGFAMGEWGSSWEFHTQWDTIEHVNPESWQLGGIVFGTLALDIAGVR